jgi:DNA-binding transcriptional MerR regulator
MYQINQLARLAGVTVRTLHHYDHIGLLAPGDHSEGGYRLYGRAELLRLQEILLYRELDLPLKTIKELLDDPQHDSLKSLAEHRDRLKQQQARIARIIDTIDNTIIHLKENNMPLNDRDLYGGLSQEEIDAMNREVDEQYDPEIVAQSRERVSKLSKQQWEGVQAQGDRVNQRIAEAMDLAPTDASVQQLVAKHHAWIENFYDCNATVYRGLAEMYVSDERFTAYYEKIKPGLAAFLSKAMIHFAENSLKN